jgi:protein tyrosine/serine phosphatase
MMRRKRQIFFVAVILWFAVSARAEAWRPARWAQPFAIVGLTNSFRVSPNLYRGSQPTAEGMRQLQQLGVKSVVNLRSFHSDKDELTGTTLKSFRFETKPWHAEADDVISFLRIVSDTNNLPVYVHCQRGADRTGTMCALYRLVICGWTKDEAIAELRDGGFHFAPVWKNLVRFIQQADVEKIRQAVARPMLKK